MISDRSWKARIVWITINLEKKYGNPLHGNKKNPTDELFYIFLTKKSRPESYKAVYKQLKSVCGYWDRVLSLSAMSLFKILRPLGLGKIRAKELQAICRKLKKDFGRVTLAPLRRMNFSEAHRYLISLPGIGEKYARCILMYSFGYDISPMDSHAIRIMKRQGLVPEQLKPNDVHKLVDKLLPKGYSLRLHVNLVAHGRTCCRVKSPRCNDCSIKRSCETFINKQSSVIAA